MNRVFLVWIGLLMITTSAGQNVSTALKNAWLQFERDPQMRQAMASLYVADAGTGKEIFAQNSAVGLAPASTQKLLTSATAYALLGKGFRYQTRFGMVKTGTSNNLVIQPSGDPTLGSWRWKETGDDKVLQRIGAAMKGAGATGVQNIVICNGQWTEEGIPGGWIWEDVGNYFGAGAYGLNWRENQFDVLLKSGNNLGGAVSVVATEPKLYDYTLSRASTAAKGTGDQTLIFLPVGSREGVIRGTIPVGEQRFKVSGAFFNPVHQFAETLKEHLSKTFTINTETPALIMEDGCETGNLLHTEVSPPLDSIVYWLNQKSVNLYAEALLKTIALQQQKSSATSAGTDVTKAFWKAQGIAATEINIQDGSGLSPQNRVTTKAQVAILLYAKKQDWFAGFYASLPLYNGMKMKSGTIGGVKGFTGYHTSKSGTTYAFSFLVNNYNGASAAMVQKMYTVLNTLK
jgi:D-alanyl-D-alanine carboxypeptidase/D-alanyl-D-alanine-endopeptidase (penicillin-binding protein 4)